MELAVQRSRQRSARVVVLGWLLVCSGCLVDVRLGAGGAGALALRYRLDERVTLGGAADRLAAPSVVVRSARIDRQGYGTFKLTFADVQALPTTAMFKNLSVTRAAGTEPGTTTVVAKYVQPKPIRLAPEQLQRFGNEMKVVVRLPGPIVASNAATGGGDVATWVVPLETLLSGSETVFSVTYRDVAPGRTAGPA
jgi:hypothetical protein